MNTNRIEAFSENVFGVAFTLLVLDFRPPNSMADLFSYLTSLWPQLLGYCISFLLVGLIWANHRAIFLHINKGDRMLVFLNTLLLANVAFLPFPTSLLARAIGTHQGLVEATFFYGLVLTIGGVFFNALWLYASFNMRKQAQAKATHIRKISIRFALGPIAYLLATLCSFASPVFSIGLYVVLIVYFWLPGKSEELLKV